MSSLGSSPIPEHPLPGVSYVMPVLNEAPHIEAAVTSLLDQDYQGPCEITLALGPSSDDTEKIVKSLVARDKRIKTVHNPKAATPIGMNLAIKASSYPIVIRVDAHSVLPNDYARIAVETLLKTQADNVGGIMDAQGVTPFEKAVARAYDTKVGLGGSPFHVGGKEGPAETVYLGVFKRESLLTVGMFNEEIRRGQDWELNRRIREAGGLVWFTPRLRVVYRPRTSFTSLIRQMFSTGLWRGELSRRFGSGLRYFIPPLMVTATTLGIITGIVGLILSPSVAGTLLIAGWIVPACYIAFIAVASVVSGRKMGWTAGWYFPLVLTVIHFSWGVGFILSYTRIIKNIASRSGR